MSRQRTALSERRPTLTSERPQFVMHRLHMCFQEALATEMIPTDHALKRSYLCMHHTHVSITIAPASERRVTLRACIRP